MDLTTIIIANIGITAIYFWSSAYILHLLLGKPFRVKSNILNILLFILLNAVGASLLSSHDITTYGYIQGATYIVILLVQFAISFWIWGRIYNSVRKNEVYCAIFIESAFTGIILMFTYIIDLSFLTSTLSIPSAYIQWIYALITVVVSIALAHGISRKTRIIPYFQGLYEHTHLWIFIGILYIIVDGAAYYGVSLLRLSTMLEQYIATFILVFGYLMILLGISIITRDSASQERIKQSQALILQQQSHLQRLEQIQKDLRMIQHDYKNMLAGLYVQASEGNTAAVKDYIDRKLLKVDGDVQKGIKQMNQLSQIQLVELKSLILTKMITCEKQGIYLDVEVMNPVEKVAMKTEDLLRCVGILVDNAIEEAQKSESPVVTFALLKEQSKLTMLVKNPTKKNIELTKIWQEGYSTKGENRGLGLSSYKKVLSGYRNIAQETLIEDGYFIQILMVLN